MDELAVLRRRLDRLVLERWTSAESVDEHAYTELAEREMQLLRSLHGRSNDGGQRGTV